MRRQTRVGIALAVAMVLGAAALLVWRATERSGSPSEPVDDVVREPASPQVPTVAGGLPPGAGADEVDRLWRVWRAVEEQSVDVLPVYEDGWSEAGRTLVDVSGAVDAVGTWQVGDRMSVELPHLGATYESTVERVDRLGHVHSVRGLIVDSNGQQRRVVVTVGPGRVFAYIDTAAGPYELVANDRLGWLLPSSSMMAGIDFSKPDYLLRDADQRNDDDAN